MIGNFVQMATGFSTSSVSSFAASAMTVTAGNAIVVCMAANTVGGTSLLASDNLRNSYITAIYKFDVTAGIASCIGRSIRVLGGSTTVTATPNAASFISLSAQEYTGMADGLGPTSQNVQTSANMSPLAVTPVWPAIYVCCWTHNGGANQSFTYNISAEGWYGRANLTATADEPLGSQDLLSSGTRTGSATIVGPAATFVAVVATFQLLSDVAVTAPAVVNKRIPIQQRLT